MNKKNLAGYTVLAVTFTVLGAIVATMQANRQASMHASAHATLQEGKTAPAGAQAVAHLYAQSLDDLAGKPQALAQWKGKPLLVNFWASWCAPCVSEMPELSALAAEDGGKHVNVIGIGIDSPSNLAEFVQKTRVAYPLYVGGMGATDLARELGSVGGGLPFTVLIGADGQIRKTYLGRLKFDALRADLAKL